MPTRFFHTIRPRAAGLLIAILAVFVLAAPISLRAQGARPLVRMQPPKLRVQLPNKLPANRLHPQARSFKWAGEELYYSVRLNGAEALRAILRAGKLRKGNNRSYVPISAKARSVGFFANIYPLDDRANTFLDPNNYEPLRSEKSFHERGKSRQYKVDYIHSTYRAKVEKTKKTRTFHFNYSIPGTTHDMISWMYDLRDHRHLKVGQAFTYYIYDGWKLSQVDMKVVGKEDVYTPMGWFKAWKLSFVRKIMRSRRRHNKHGKPIQPILRVKVPHKHAGHLWLSRDENHLPIKVAIDTKFGTSEAVLVKYKPHVRE